MQDSQNPYDAPQAPRFEPTYAMPVAGAAPGTTAQRTAFPENSIEELRRWKQHINSLKIFVFAQGIAVLICLGATIAIAADSSPNAPVYFAVTFFVLILAMSSMFGAWTRRSWAVPLIWFWIGGWLLIGIGGAIVALSKSTDLFVGVLQIVAYAVIMAIFVGKALLESERYFGPDRISENELQEELAYREMNSIP